MAIVLLIGCMLVVPVVMALLSRPLLRDVGVLSRENARLRELYGRARQDSLLDGLTGLGNHRGFQEELAPPAGARRDARARPSPCSSSMSTTSSASTTSKATLVATACWRPSARSSCRHCVATIAPSGSVGDEFAILLPGADVDTGLTIARRLLAGALNGGDPSHPVEAFSLSIGVSAFPAPSNQGSLLYRHADAALYWCKRHGRTNAAAFDPGRHGIATDDRSIEDLTEVISTILADGMLRPVYQPIFSLVTGKPVGYEGLIRPTDGAAIADASALFAAAERTDRTVELDFACLKVVAEGVGELDPDVYLSVDLSPRTLESELFHPA